jgi:hypothetical protein
MKKFYIVVRHPLAPRTFKNIWLDDDRLDTITTTEEIGLRCGEAIKRKERIFVHRCGYVEANASPCIICSVKVASSEKDESDKSYKVTFSDHNPIGAKPAYKPVKGENSYEL